MGAIRIIGGEWRSRKLHVIETPGLRPTPSRLRETLFNWLAPVISGARCLDVFAGTGILGLEAASRGAAAVVFVEQQARLAQALQTHIQLFKTTQVKVIHSESLRFLSHSSPFPCEIVFLDPPFSKNLLSPCCALLEQKGWLAERAYIYLEMARKSANDPKTAPILPPDWQVIRRTHAGEAEAWLAERKKANV